MIRLWAWLIRHEKIILICVMVLCVLCLFIPDIREDTVRILCIVFSVAAGRALKKVWFSTIAMLFILPIAMYANWSSIVVREVIKPVPVRPLPSVSANVILGGDAVRIHKGPQDCFSATICFYVPDSDRCVIAGHSCNLDAKTHLKALIQPFGESKNGVLNICPEISPFASNVEVLSDTGLGVALSGLTVPDTYREVLAIGGAQDISVGEPAVLYTWKDGKVAVKVLGFGVVQGKHLLFIQADRSVDLGPGTSGSLLVQNGKIIGVFLGRYALPYRGPRLYMLRLACEVFAELKQVLIPGN